MINAHHYFIHKINILFPQKTPTPRVEFIIQSHLIVGTLVTPIQCLRSCQHLTYVYVLNPRLL